MCIPVPFYHCFGMVIGNLANLTHATTTVLPAPSFEPLATLRAMEAERCTSVLGVPTMFIAMLAHPEFHDVRSVVAANRHDGRLTVPCRGDEAMRRRDAHERGHDRLRHDRDVTGVLTQTSPDDPLDKRVGTVGRVLPHVQVKIIDPATGETLGLNEPGEFCAKGYSVMLGYWNEPQMTADSIDADGWMHSGDIAVMDDDLYVSIVGRIKDMIIRGGENIYPREVEEFLYTHPDIVDVQVVGVPDEKYGEEMVAWVRLREGATHDPRRSCRVLRRPHRPLQDPAVHPRDRRVPDDRHRERFRSTACARCRSNCSQAAELAVQRCHSAAALRGTQRPGRDLRRSTGCPG